MTLKMKVMHKKQHNRNLSMNKNNLKFQGHATEIDTFIYNLLTIGFHGSENIPHEQFHKKIDWEVTNPGGFNNPLIGR